jgi:hypothetical protein
MTPTFCRGGIYLIVAYRTPLGLRTTVTLPYDKVLKARRKFTGTDSQFQQLLKECAQDCFQASSFERVGAVLELLSEQICVQS